MPMPVRQVTNSIAVTFNGNGSVASFTPAIPHFDLSAFTTGAVNSAIDLDFGTVGQTNGLTRFSSNTTVRTSKSS